MPSYLHIQVNKPCQENWEAMHPAEQGRYCDSCKKSVIDFTSMSDEQLVAYFKNHTGSVCGRFETSQLEHPKPLPVKRIPWLKYFFQVSLPALMLSYKSSAQRILHKNIQPAVLLEPKSVQPKLLVNKQLITGKITGYSGEPVAYATIMIAGTHIGTAADSNGVFSLQVSANERFLEVSAVGYQKKIIPIRDTAVDVCMNIPLKDNVRLSSLRLQSNYRSVMVGMVSTVVRSSRRTKKEEIKKPQLPSLAISPNPAPRNGNISIQWKKPLRNNQYLVVYNMAGQQLFRNTLHIDQPQMQTQVSLNLLSAGTYIIHVTDAKTGKTEVGRVVVR